MHITRKAVARLVASKTARVIVGTLTAISIISLSAGQRKTMKKIIVIVGTLTTISIILGVPFSLERIRFLHQSQR